MHWSRRQFLIALSALAAGCQPAYRKTAPTAYAPGSGFSPTPTSSLIPTSATASTQPLPKEVPVTDINRLYVHSYPNTPKIENWALHIDGLVTTPLSLK